jgi:putative lipoprotein
VLVVVLALLAPVGGSAHAADPDPWFGSDKALHFSLSAGIAAGGYAVAAQLTDDRRWRLASGAGLAIAAGAGKELLDRYDGGDSSWRDFTWDVIGTATGVGIAWLIDRLVDGAATPAATARASRGKVVWP